MATRRPNSETSATAPRPVRATRQNSLDTLRSYPDFRLVLIGNFVAQGGQWLQLLTIGWLVLKLTDGNALLTGTVIGVRTLPVLAIGPWAGVLADRMDRRKVVMVTQTCMATAACAFAFLVLATDLDADPISGPLLWWHPFVYMIIAGIAHSIIQPVRQAMIANTVPRQSLTSALALNGMVYPSTRILAPVLGGLIIATLGFNGNFFLEAAAYVGIVLLLIPVRLRYREEASRQHASVFSSMRDGLKFVWQEKSILQLIVMSIIPNFIFQPLVFVLPVFTTEVLGRGPGAGGMLASAIGIGGIAAGVIIATAGYFVRKGLATFFGLMAGCFFVLLFSQSTELLLSMALLAGMGFSQYVFRVANSTLIQTTVPDALRGRVMSIYQLDNGLTPLAVLAISWVVHIWTPSGTFAVVGIVGLATSVLMTVAFHRVRRLE